MRTNAKVSQLWEDRSRFVTRTGVAADLATQHLFQVFSINGGPVEITYILGRSRHAKDVVAQTLEGGFTPTGLARQIWAAAGATTATITGPDMYLTWSGVLGAAMIVLQTGTLLGMGALGSVLAGTSGAKNVFGPGVIDITTAAFNDASGLIDWTIRYTPLFLGATITAL